MSAVYRFSRLDWQSDDPCEEAWEFDCECADKAFAWAEQQAQQGRAVQLEIIGNCGQCYADLCGAMTSDGRFAVSVTRQGYRCGCDDRTAPPGWLQARLILSAAITLE